MPLHNWSNVESGIFHAFHTAWITEIQNALNAGLLPENYYALAEQHAGDYVADVLALHVPPTPEDLTPFTVPCLGAIADLDLYRWWRFADHRLISRTAPR